MSASKEQETRPVHEGLFRRGEGGAPFLVSGRCRRCRELHFPMASTCPYCSGTSIDEEELSGRATLWAWTAVTAPPPGYVGEVPYGFGVVQLDEGLRVITRLTEPDPSRLSFGEPMHLEIVPVHQNDDGTAVLTYAFSTDAGTR